MATVDLYDVVYADDRMTRDDALTMMGRMGWDYAVNLSGVLDDTLGAHDTYLAGDVYALCGY